MKNMHFKPQKFILTVIFTIVLAILLPIRFITIYQIESEIITDEEKLKKVCPEEKRLYSFSPITGEKFTPFLHLTCSNHWKARSIKYWTDAKKVSFIDFSKRDFQRGKKYLLDKERVEPMIAWSGSCDVWDISSDNSDAKKEFCLAWLNTPKEYRK